MKIRLHDARRSADGLPGRLALLLLLLAPLCVAACGVHEEAGSASAMEAAEHADCHGMAPMAAEAADDDDRDCCDDHDASLTPERAPSLPAAVLAFTGLTLEHLAGRASAPVVHAPPEPGGRSPGRLLLLLVLSFLE